jgi:serine/arginine repetitive matrix protein 1
VSNNDKKERDTDRVSEHATSRDRQLRSEQQHKRKPQQKRETQAKKQQEREREREREIERRRQREPQKKHHTATHAKKENTVTSYLQLLEIAG